MRVTSGGKNGRPMTAGAISSPLDPIEYRLLTAINRSALRQIALS
jgi:hypothetical protein